MELEEVLLLSFIDLRMFQGMLRKYGCVPLLCSEDILSSDGVQLKCRCGAPPCSFPCQLGSASNPVIGRNCCQLNSQNALFLPSISKMMQMRK